MTPEAAFGAARTALMSNATALDAAKQLGIADELTGDGSALDRARELAVEVAGASPMALRHLRELTAMATVHPLDQHLDLEEERLMEIWRGPDFAEGVGAFLEKRRPNFAHR